MRTLAVDYDRQRLTSANLMVMSAIAALLVVVSAVGVIYSSYKSRQLFSQLQQLRSESMQLEEEWGRLLLEQSTWSSHERIDRLARTRLQMVVPDPAQIKVIEE